MKASTQVCGTISELLSALDHKVTDLICLRPGVSTVFSMCCYCNIWREDMYKHYLTPEPTRVEEEDNQEIYKVEKFSTLEVQEDSEQKEDENP